METVITYAIVAVAVGLWGRSLVKKYRSVGGADQCSCAGCKHAGDNGGCGKPQP